MALKNALKICKFYTNYAHKRNAIKQYNAEFNNVQLVVVPFNSHV